MFVLHLAHFHYVQPQGRDKATERIMSDLDSTFAKMRSEVGKDKVTASVRKEALGPTRDAIKVCRPDPFPFCDARICPHMYSLQ